MPVLEYQIRVLEVTMAERAGDGARSDGESGGSDEYEYVTMTAAEVLEKLEEVGDGGGSG